MPMIKDDEWLTLPTQQKKYGLLAYMQIASIVMQTSKMRVDQVSLIAHMQEAINQMETDRSIKIWARLAVLVLGYGWTHFVTEAASAIGREISFLRKRS